MRAHYHLDNYHTGSDDDLRFYTTINGYIDPCRDDHADRSDIVYIFSDAEFDGIVHYINVAREHIEHIRASATAPGDGQ
jgi:hypothetical protein